MPIPTKPRRTPASRRARPLVIVGRRHVALYDALNRAFGGRGGIPVLLDRRQAERRRAVQSVPEERRRGERRCFPRIDDRRPLPRDVLVHPHHRRPHD